MQGYQPVIECGDRVENRIGTDFVDFTLYFSNLTNRLHL
jgi:hypothetical protein